MIARHPVVRDLTGVLVALLLLGCASDRGAPRSDRTSGSDAASRGDVAPGFGVGLGSDIVSNAEFAATWRDYLALPAQRALAIAGDPQRDHWVAGAAGGHATREQAESAALGECHRQRRMSRMQPACVLYASGDEIVWRGR